MRLFVAVLPPKGVVAELHAAVAGARELPGADGLRWAQRAGWHLTLCFIGEVEEDLLPALEERLGRAARRYGPYGVRLAGAGRFGNNVLWIGVEGERAGLARLAEATRAAARRAGANPAQEHGFNPHLTLARGRPGARLRPFAEVLAPYQGREWTADAIALVRSHPSTPGVPGAQPRYETMRTWPLGH
jgi:2'-5' RNA ligase